jgi:hypothetical protein
VYPIPPHFHGSGHHLVASASPPMFGRRPIRPGRADV